jgi:AmiR/NasT family two-component response regulator
MDEYERAVAKDVMAQILKPIIESMVKMAVDYVVTEAYKKDKGRHQPFWTKQWRKR